ncbi:hypothetical protein B7P43_G02435 [Cryptotermes secundus]|uniref:DUF4817 domain-containing protein n=1 Tax=Cryptotermes secundus TaxID=105785 RepID=A0A2J7QFH8_9NEOP|nr:hypothetical protein B7P43_G02435 [Cryptotermes secundus]
MGRVVSCRVVPEVLVAMEQWYVQERVVAVRSYYRHGDSLVEALREFRRHFNLAPRDHAPSKHAIRTWVQNFEETGSVGKRKSSGRPGSAWTPENVEAVQASVLRSPHRSVRKVAAAVTVSRRSVQRILHELKFHPYKLQLVQELKPNDHLLRRQFCEAIMNKTDENPDFIENLWMSDEAHFHLNGDYLKSVVYNTSPTTLAELRRRITEEIAAIQPDTLLRAMRNFQDRLAECIRQDGHHLRDVIFKL